VTGPTGPAIQKTILSGSAISGTVIPAIPLGFTPVAMIAIGRGTDTSDNGQISFVGFSTGVSSTKGTTVFYPTSVPGPTAEFNPDALQAHSVNLNIKLEVTQFDANGIAVQWASFSGLSSFEMSAVVIGI
jgi:hypothetical protein